MDSPYFSSTKCCLPNEIYLESKWRCLYLPAMSSNYRIKSILNRMTVVKTSKLSLSHEMNGRVGFPLWLCSSLNSWNNPYLALEFQLQVERLLLMMMTQSRGREARARRRAGRFERGKERESHNNHSLPASFSVLSPS